MTHWELMPASTPSPPTSPEQDVPKRGETHLSVPTEGEADRGQTDLVHTTEKCIEYVDDETNTIIFMIRNERLFCAKAKADNLVNVVHITLTHVGDGRGKGPDEKLDDAIQRLSQKMSNLHANQKIQEMMKKIEILHKAFSFFNLEDLIETYTSEIIQGEQRRQCAHTTIDTAGGIINRGNTVRRRMSVLKRVTTATRNLTSQSVRAARRWSFRLPSFKGRGTVEKKGPKWIDDHSKGLDLSRRHETDGTLSIMIRSKMPCELLKVIAIVSESDLHINWVPYLKKCNKLGTPSRSSLVMQEILQLPLLGQRETLMMAFGVDALEELGAMVLSIATPDPTATEIMGVPIPLPNKKVPRLAMNELCFFLMPTDNGASTHMYVYANVNPGLNLRLMSGLVNMIMKRMVRSFLGKIIHLCRTFDQSQYPQKLKENKDLYEWLDQRMIEWRDVYQFSRERQHVLESKTAGTFELKEEDLANVE
eukprot:GHVO01052654.1.p1 GENE.GHVO01052654.1~~GHVO01052654.1.p1  ORF type:complete len:478 (+),score=96.29 GHVO01052654.1:145-1578(+)